GVISEGRMGCSPDFLISIVGLHGLRPRRRTGSAPEKTKGGDRSPPLQLTPLVPGSAQSGDVVGYRPDLGVGQPRRDLGHLDIVVALALAELGQLGRGVLGI